MPTYECLVKENNMGSQLTDRFTAENEGEARRAIEGMGMTLVEIKSIQDDSGNEVSSDSGQQSGEQKETGTEDNTAEQKQQDKDELQEDSSSFRYYQEGGQRYRVNKKTSSIEKLQWVELNDKDEAENYAIVSAKGRNYTPINEQSRVRVARLEWVPLDELQETE